jgi:hypothetical protein
LSNLSSNQYWSNYVSYSNTVLSNRIFITNYSKTFTKNSNTNIDLGKSNVDYRLDVHGDINFEHGGMFSNSIP